MKFSDGVTFDTSGEYRTTRRHDGLYVVGGGLLIPVKDNEEAQKIIDDLNKSKKEKKIKMNKLEEALNNPVWKDHKLGDSYVMDRKPDLWKISYYPIFEDGKTKEVYDEPRALVEKPIQGGIDFREIPLRYLTKIQPISFQLIPLYNPKYEKIATNAKRIHWTFLHGKLEEDCGHDVFGIIGTNPDDLVEGVYNTTFEGKGCTLFYWLVESWNKHKGLMVYTSDKESYDYAEKCFINKEDSI